MAKHNELGARGEEMATDYLKDKGYRIKERNFRYGKGEVDIIAEESGTVVFVEVKTRSNTTYGAPREAVTPYKQEMLRKTATYYLLHKSVPNTCGRFDVIEILFQGDGKYKLTHIRNAF